MNIIRKEVILLCEIKCTGCVDDRHRTTRPVLERCEFVWCNMMAVLGDVESCVLNTRVEQSIVFHSAAPYQQQTAQSGHSHKHTYIYKYI